MCVCIYIYIYIYIYICARARTCVKTVIWKHELIKLDTNTSQRRPADYLYHRRYAPLKRFIQTISSHLYVPKHKCKEKTSLSPPPTTTTTKYTQTK